jgi:hypothetical protein
LYSYTLFVNYLHRSRHICQKFCSEMYNLYYKISRFWLVCQNFLRLCKRVHLLIIGGWTLIYALHCFRVINQVFHVKKIQNDYQYILWKAITTVSLHVIPLKCHLYHQKKWYKVGISLYWFSKTSLVVGDLQNIAAWGCQTPKIFLKLTLIRFLNSRKVVIHKK